MGAKAVMGFLMEGQQVREGEELGIAPFCQGNWRTSYMERGLADKPGGQTALLSSFWYPGHEQKPAGNAPCSYGHPFLLPGIPPKHPHLHARLRLLLGEPKPRHPPAG